MVIFYGGIYSQWHYSEFIIEGTTYNCAEQYMMHQKALAFGDLERAAQIMRTNDPSEQKQIGREVENFNPHIWYIVAKSVVFRGNMAKFSQNPLLAVELEMTGHDEIVEASPTDVIWGVGLSESNPDVLDKAKWRGQNLLGAALMEVRDCLR